ncbi:MAG: hypothetical protein Q9217_006587 [Psora testacea]
MSSNEALVDLSLFALSPTDDRHFSMPDASHITSQPAITDHVIAELGQTGEEFYRTGSAPEDRRADHFSKPLPPLPPKTICKAISIPREGDSASTSILTHMKRKRTELFPTSSGDNLLRRRNVASPPQLTLSVPQSASNNRQPASEMVWMPEEQIWLLVGDMTQDHYPGHDEHPTPPAYSPSRYYTRSEPSTRAPSRWSMSPPMSPIRSQLQSLIQPRDEERLSPLFQEAMNSVPMDDTFAPPPPPTYERTVRGRSLPPTPPSSHQQLQTSTPSKAPATHPPARAATTSNQYTTTVSAYSETTSNLARSQTGAHKRSRLKPSISKYSLRAPGFDSTSRAAPYDRPRTSEGLARHHGGSLDPLHQEMAVPSRSWHILARKLAVSRPGAT